MRSFLPQGTVFQERADEPRQPPPPPGWECLGVRFQLWTREPLLQQILAFAQNRDRRAVVGYANLHAAAIARRDPRLDQFYRTADLVLLDGMILTWVVRLAGVPASSRHRHTYVDWLDSLLRSAAARRMRVFLLGGREEVTAAAVRNLSERIPGLALAFHDGYFDVTEGSEASEQVLREIEAFQPHLLLVGMGMPRQEEWILRNRKRVQVGAILACGGCMDYLSGTVRVPPRWLGRLGLEWLFRLIYEPRRLARRYLVEPLMLLGPILGEVGRRRSRRHL